MTTIDQHQLRASVNIPNGVLDVRDARITLDESWAPYVQATLTCATPSAALLDAIDPRRPLRASVSVSRRFGSSDPLSVLSSEFAGQTVADMSASWAGQKLRDVTSPRFHPWNSFGSRPGQYRSLSLSVRSRVRAHRDGTMTLTLASDEALLQDYALVDTKPYAPTLSSIRAVVGSVLARIGRALAPGTADGTIDPDAALWNPGISAWDYVTPIVQAAGLRLWCDEAGLFHLDDGATAPAGVLVVSTAHNATDAEDTINRDSEEWYDAVVITYRWDDIDGQQHTAYDAASVPGYSKVLTLEKRSPFPGAGAAAAMLNRRLGFGRALAPRIVSDYTATPGMSVTATLDDTPVQTGYLSAVTWSWPECEMDIRTRGLVDTPSTAYTFGPAGVSYLDVPAGISYNTFDWSVTNGN